MYHYISGSTRGRPTHLQFEPVDGIASDFRHAVDEFLLRKLALSRRLEFPGDDEHDLALRVQTQILEKPHHSFRRHFIIFLGIFVSVECVKWINKLVEKRDQG